MSIGSGRRTSLRRLGHFAPVCPWFEPFCRRTQFLLVIAAMSRSSPRRGWAYTTHLRISPDCGGSIRQPRAAARCWRLFGALNCSLPITPSPHPSAPWTPSIISCWATSPFAETPQIPRGFPPRWWTMRREEPYSGCAAPAVEQIFLLILIGGLHLMGPNNLGFIALIAALA